MMYLMPLSSKSVMLAIGGLRGVNTPSPPAMATEGARCFVPLSVVTMNWPSSSLSIVTALSPKVKPALNGLICSIRLSTNSPASIVGNPGMS